MKKGYDPNQPREPKGTPTGGQWTSSDFMNGFRKGVGGYYNDGKPYLRYARPDDVMSDWGHAMFADYREGYFDGLPSNVKAYQFVPMKNDPRVVDTESEKFRDIVKEKFLEDVERGYYIGDINDEFQNIINIYEDDELSLNEFVSLFSPSDIVNSAEAYDSILSQWLFERVLEPNGWMAVITPDGAVVYDESMIEEFVP